MHARMARLQSSSAGGWRQGGRDAARSPAARPPRSWSRPAGRSPGSRAGLEGPGLHPLPAHRSQWVPEPRTPADAGLTRLPLRGQRRNLTGFPFSRAWAAGSPVGARTLGKRARRCQDEVAGCGRRDHAAGRRHTMRSSRTPQGCTMPHSDFLATALEAARAAADVVRHYYQRNLTITIKADKSPVTEADVETEKTIRAHPRGEVSGSTASTARRPGTSALDAEYVWVVDPIDGTKAFVREYPMFSTQIALMRRGPADRRRVVGAGVRRTGLRRNRRRRLAQRAADTRERDRHDREPRRCRPATSRRSRRARSGPRSAGSSAA